MLAMNLLDSPSPCSFGVAWPALLLHLTGSRLACSCVAQCPVIPYTEAWVGCCMHRAVGLPMCQDLCRCLPTGLSCSCSPQVQAVLALAAVQASPGRSPSATAATTPPAMHSSWRSTPSLHTAPAAAGSSSSSRTAAAGYATPPSTPPLFTQYGPPALPRPAAQTAAGVGPQTCQTSAG